MKNDTNVRDPLDRTLPYPSAEDLERVFLAAEPNEVIIYHIGYLAIDRSSGGPLSSIASVALGTVADYVMELRQEGRAQVTLRRIAPGVYEYSLKKRETLDTSCENERGENPYKVLSDKEPPRVVKDPPKPKFGPRLILAGHLSPKQQHDQERAPYVQGGQR